MTFICPTCGKAHNELPMDLQYHRPADYFKIPDDEIPKRVLLTADICVIDDSEFYIRGVLALPVKDYTDEFRWGVWAQVQLRDFKRYLELWKEDGRGLPSFEGKLSGGVRDYPESDGLDVLIYLQTADQRPRFQVVSDEHPLGKDQREGVTLAKVHDFVEPLLKSP